MSFTHPDDSPTDNDPEELPTMTAPTTFTFGYVPVQEVPVQAVPVPAIYVESNEERLARQLADMRLQNQAQQVIINHTHNTPSKVLKALSTKFLKKMRRPHPVRHGRYLAWFDTEMR